MQNQLHLKYLHPILVFLTIVFANGIPAQHFVQKIRQITTKEGLLTPGVKSVYKDSKGLMWFAFATGIASYDGYTVRRYDDFLPDSCSINSYKYCTCFQEDLIGNLWIGTLKNGFAKLNRATGKFTYYNLDPSDPMAPAYNTIGCMMRDHNGVLWLGSGNTGIYKFFPENDSLVNYNPRSVYDHPGVVAVHSLLEDASGMIWVGTAQGLFTFDQKSGEFTQILTEPPIPERFNKIKPILQDAFGNIWFGSDWGVFRYNRKNNQWKHYFTQTPDQTDNLEGGWVTGMVEVKTETDHKMWIATQAALITYDFSTEKLSHIYGKAKDKEATVIGGGGYIYYDGENKLLWISSNGISLADLRENAFHYTYVFQPPDTLSTNDARCLFEDHNGTIWAGTFSNGMFEFDRNLQFAGHYKPSSWKRNQPDVVTKNQITLIFEDSGRHLWVGSSGEGLSVFDRKKKTFETVYFETTSGLEELIWVLDMLEDRFGKLWLATQRGLFCIDTPWEKGQVIPVFEHHLLSTSYITDLFEDSKGRLWMTSGNKGVFCLLPENRDSKLLRHYLHHFYSTGLFANRNANEIYEDISGKLWMRSETALFYYNEETDSIEYHEHFRKVLNGENFVFTGDKSGHLWFISEQGLVRYNPNDGADRSLKLFSASEGQLYTGINYAPFLQSLSGHIYFGGSGPNGAGFCRFHPDSVHPDNLHLPEVMITDFRIRNEPVELDSTIDSKKLLRLKYNQNFFSLEFVAIDYRNPEMNQHAYILEGYDKGWVHSGARRFANYTGVPPGEYVFRVKGSNNDGYWNEEGAQIMLIITPPPWKTWWAYTIYTLFLAGLIFGWRRYDLKRLRLRQALEIEHVEAEKLKELDKMKSRFFANISHEFRTPLTLILGPMHKLKEKTKDKFCLKELDVMHRNALRLLKLINQLLDLSRLEADQMNLHASPVNLVEMLKGYVQSFESLARQKNIQLSFVVRQEQIAAWIDRDKLEKILYNLLSNAFKFTEEGGRIEVSISPQPAVGTKQAEVHRKWTEDWRLKTGESDGQWVSITVSDTGCGIAPEKLPHIFDRFYQAGESYLKDQEGTGIGLALTKELVELHYGQISVESSQGKGTTFTLILPLGNEHLKPEEMVTESAYDAVIPAASDNGLNLSLPFVPPEVDHRPHADENNLENLEETTQPLVLIVEDNDDLRTYIRSYLDADYLVSEAFDGEMGLQKAIEKIPDLIISDVMMPKMDGIQMCRKLKTDKCTSHIPVILLTAKAAMEDKLEGLETGADDFITKPFDPHELLVRIKNLILQRAKLRDYYLKQLTAGKEQEAPVLSLDQQFLEKAHRIVKENMTDFNFSVEAFAEEMAMSRVQLHRKIKALLNQTATEFIRNLRLMRAASLIKAGKGNITEIAFEVGFNNLSWFARCFQEYYGENPSAFASRHGKP